MKIWALILAAFAFVTSLQAQEATSAPAPSSPPPISASQYPSIPDPAQIGTSTNSAGMTLNQQSKQPQKAAPGTPLKTQQLKVVPMGMIYEMSQKGLVVISPTAPASMGYYPLSVPKQPYPRDTVTSQITQQDREADGIHLFGWAW